MGRGRDVKVECQNLPDYISSSGVALAGQAPAEGHPLSGISAEMFRESMRQAGLAEPSDMLRLLQEEGSNLTHVDTVRKWYDHPENMPQRRYEELVRALRNQAGNNGRLALDALIFLKAKAGAASEREAAADPSTFAAHRREALKDLLDCMDDGEIEYLSMQALDYLAGRVEPRDLSEDGKYLKAATVLYLTTRHRGASVKPSRPYLALAGCDYPTIEANIL